MAEDQVKFLEKALQKQQIIMQKLQAELDEERKAAASGAEEALSMILRLQEEKSTQKLESLQYKRMIDEKLQHDEETMAILREIIFLRDTEIQALRYQIQVCKHKLLSLCSKSGRFPWLSEYILGKGEYQNLGRRNTSLPAMRFQELFMDTDGLGQGDIGSSFDDFGKKLSKTYRERKFEHLFRSKSSIKEIFSVSSESKSELYDSEDDFSSLKSSRGKVPFLPSQQKWPRRTCSVVLLQNLCTKTESISEIHDTFEILESLKRTKEHNLDFGNEERVEKCKIESDLEHVKVSMGCVENEMRKMRESDSVAWEMQLKLLAEIRDKISAIECHIQQKDVEIEETKHQQKRVEASCMPLPSKDQYDDMLMSYYIEAMLSFSI